MHKVQIACFMFKVRHSELPADFIDMFKINADVHVYSTRHADDYNFSFSITNCLRIPFAILVQCCGTLLNLILRCYQILISLSAYINDMSSQ